MAGLVADLFCADAELLISIRAIRETGVGPPVLVPIARIGDVGIGKSKIALGFRVVGGLVGQVDFLAVPFLDFLVDVGHIDGLRSEEHTSELQSQSNIVCRLLLEKKKTIYYRFSISN